MPFSFYRLFFVAFALLGAGCGQYRPKIEVRSYEKQTRITVSSEPQGAHVLVNKFSATREHDASFLGTTPLMRNRALKNRGENLILNLPGYETWRGTISPSKPNVTAQLVPLKGSSRPQDTTEPLPLHAVQFVHLGLEVSTVLDGPEDKERAQIVSEKLTSLLRTGIESKTALKADGFVEHTLPSPDWAGVLLSRRLIREDQIGYFPTQPTIKIPDSIPLSPAHPYTLLTWFEASVPPPSIMDNKWVRNTVTAGQVAAVAIALAHFGGDSQYTIQPRYRHDSINPANSPYFCSAKKYIRGHMLLIDTQSKQLLWTTSVHMPMSTWAETEVKPFTDLLIESLPSRYLPAAVP